MTTIETVLEELKAALAEAGFDLVADGTVGAYDARVPEAYRLGGAPEGAVLLVGNDRRAWPRFLEWVAVAERRGLAHPFDMWTVEAVRGAIGPVLARHGVAGELRFVFEGPPRGFAAQHLAEATGLACRGPAGLSVHPELGPWFALRAALVLGAPGRAAAPPVDVCGGCAARPCVAALEAAMAATRGRDHRAVREAWRPWLQVRESCPVGREHRYGEQQIRWHYAHDREALK